MGKIVKNGVTYSGSSDNADNVKYNNNVSNLDATNVQEAIDKLDESVDTLNSNLTQVQSQIVPTASIESGATASKAYSVGNFLVKDGILYKVTNAIAKGDALTPANIVPTTVGGELSEIKSSSTASSKLLLDTTAVTTSEKIFTLEDDYTNYKELYFEIEMNFKSSSNIHIFTNIIRVDTIRTDYDYIVLRAVGSVGNSEGEGTVIIQFISDNNTDAKLKKVSNTYNGCRRLRIFGIKC